MKMVTRGRKGKRITAWLLAAVMALSAAGVMPAPLVQAQTVSSGDAVPMTVSGNGEGQSGGTYEFNAAELTAAADKETIAAGTAFASGYITTFGELTKRTSGEKVKSVEVGKSAGSGFSFTVSGKAEVSFTASSTGGSNTSRVGILNGTGELVADKSGKTYTDITGTSAQEVAYTLSAGTYRIVSPESEYNRGARIYTISITDSPVLPPGTTLTGSIRVSDSANLLGDTNRVQLVPENGQAITLQKGDNTVSLNPGTKYNISFTTPNEKIRALSEGKDSIQTGAENISTEIIVSSAVVKPVVKLAEGLSLAQGASLMLDKKGAGNQDVLTEGNQVELIIGQTYEVSTDMEDTQAQVNGKTEFTAWEGMTELEITLVKTKKEVAVTVEDPEGLLGSAEVKLENSKDASEVHTLQNGTSVKLNLDAIYQLSCTTADVEASVNGSKLVQVTEALDSIAVKISKKDENYHEIDLSQGLKAGTAYEGGISVLEDMTYKADDQNIGGSLYLGYVAGGNNPKTNGSSAKGTVPDSGSVLLLTAQKDGTLRVAVKINAGKTVYLVESKTGEVQSYANTGGSSEFKLMSYQVQAGGTYYFYGDGTKIPMYGITVDYREPEDWSKIAAPVLGTPVVDAGEGTITVPFTAQIGGIYADSLEVQMLLNGEVVDTVSYGAAASEGTVTFKPSASGTYTFKAFLKRSGETDKESNVTQGVAFVLPMQEPEIINVENLGQGTVKFSWKEVPEAESYRVYVDGVLKETVTVSFSRISNLTVGQEYEFGVEAVRGSDVSPRALIRQTVTAEAVKTWTYAAFGSGVDAQEKGNNGYSGSIEGNDLCVYSMNGKGKLVPASTDGLAFYYTVIDPETENFTLSADLVVDQWTYSNGQEGFGLMAADSVGTDGDASTFWNNSYMASVTKVEYYWDEEAGKVSDAGSKYTMKLGVGSQEKIGVTPENIAAGNTVDFFKSTMTTLETTAPQSGLPAGTYNVAGGYTNQGVDMGDVSTQNTFHLTIQRNNTGYFLSYTDENGQTTTNKYYHGEDGDALTKLDANNIYVGFFASRNARVNIKNVQLTTIRPEDDAPAEGRPITYVTPSYTIESAQTANKPEYEMVYYGNADGTLTITNQNGSPVVSGQHVDADTKFRVNTLLEKGSNEFEVTFTPDADYKPSAYERLSSYETVKFTFTVEYKTSALLNLYISPNGRADATGTRENPMDIYSAVKNAAPGQKLILMEGTYLLDSTVTVDRGIDGTESQRIYMIADPEGSTRPVLDFQGKCAGMVLAGDYWYFQGFDVTNSANGQKGIQVSGSHNVLDNLYAYKNGNTGIQISRYKGTDLWEDWPSDNLILNCTSYLNADAGYEDADGFAAKLTIADGNVFDGCIAAYNADDGWDLFAKVESGPIGKVVIRNSVAFKNGYVVDESGNEVNAGNGNGFKLGGSSISGYHTLKNSIAFANKAKGIDSNSCPDVQVYNCTSYNNESYNVALYTNDAKNTDFLAQGLLSFKDGNTVPEQIKVKGTQDTNQIYGSTNYYFDGDKSANAEGRQAAADWFVSLDVSAAIQGGITRNADGTINMNGFLELTALAPSDTGARLEGTASGNVTVTPDNKQELAVAEADILETLPESVLTKEVKEATGCSTVEELTAYLVEKVSGSEAGRILSGVAAGNAAVLEVKVRVSFDGGNTWEDATEENFPTAGIDIILPYPAGTSQTAHDFVVGHLITMACNGAVPGTMEYFAPEETEAGLKIHIMSASPFVIGWKEAAADSGNNGNQQGGDSNTSGGEGDNSGNAQFEQVILSAGRKSPKTFDSGSSLYQQQDGRADIETSGETAGEEQEEQEKVDVPVISATLAPVGAAKIPWQLALAAAALCLMAAAAGIWNYRKNKEE